MNTISGFRNFWCKPGNPAKLFFNHSARLLFNYSAKLFFNHSARLLFNYSAKLFYNHDAWLLLIVPQGCFSTPVPLPHLLKKDEVEIHSDEKSVTGSCRK